MSEANHPLKYLDTDEAVAAFVASIAHSREIAVDTEGASFHRFVDRIYLLQLSTRDRSAIIDPLPIAPPQTLGAMLEDPKVEVVFHDADYDLRLLHQDYGWHVRHIFDTRVAAQLLGIRAFGLGAMLERYFGMKLDKKHQRADWSMRPLPQDMLEYAAQDTHSLLELRDRLKADLEKAGRWEWAREEFERLEGTRWPDEDPAMAFLRVKGARDLNRRELALLRELVPWRDAMALQVDRATFRVVSNEVLLDIARLAPTTKDALSKVPKIPRGMVERASDAMLGAVQRGLAVPEADLPRFPRGARWDRDPTFDERVAKLKTVREAAAVRLDLDPGVLCARDRLEAVARRQPRTVAELDDVPELRRWQAAEMGKEFVQALKESSAPKPQTQSSRSPESRPRDDDESPYRN